MRFKSRCACHWSGRMSRNGPFSTIAALPMTTSIRGWRASTSANMASIDERSPASQRRYSIVPLPVWVALGDGRTFVEIFAAGHDDRGAFFAKPAAGGPADVAVAGRHDDDFSRQRGPIR